jgi:ADP-ribose pyrophosphatase
MLEVTRSRKTVFDGKLLKVEQLDVELENGRSAYREIVRHPGAVGVVTRLPDGRFAFVRQFRKAVEDDRLEIVAGLRDAGESPEESARRELREETGFCATSLRRLGAVNASPGYTDERIDIFYAETPAAPDAADPDEDEHVELVLLTAAEFVGRVRTGEICDAKTLAAWTLYHALAL